MNRNFSLYLDLLRVSAAVEVLCDHIVDYSPRNYFYHIGQLGHESVMIFFVLSGFVIAYSAETKDHDLSHYAVSRFSRLWSVLLPCLIVTPLLDAWGQSIAPKAYLYHVTNFVDLGDGLRHAFFLSQLWFDDTWYFSAAPLWSLGYEFWYYALFGALFYLKGRWRVAAVAACLLIIGPKILLLSPLWFLGVAVYHYTRKGISPRTGFIYLALSTLGLVIYFPGGLENYLTQISTRILALQPFDFASYSESFLADYVLGLIIAGNFIGVAGIANHLKLDAIAPFIRGAAGFTFSIYLYHLPLFFFANALFYDRLSVNGKATAAFIIALAGSCALGFFTERKKHLFAKPLKALRLRLTAHSA
jgi:peptidoglycan/LPS O-acetylase OafA/YrhL